MEAKALVAAKRKRLLQILAEGRKDPVYFAEEFLGLQLHDGQKLFLWGSTKTMPEKCFALLRVRYPENFQEIFNYLYNDSNLFILVPSNRWGKTLAISVKHVWMLFYKIGKSVDAQFFSRAKYHTFNISPVGEQSMACYNYINDILESKFIYRGLDGKSRNNQCKIGFLFKSKNDNARTITMADNRVFKCATLGNDTKGATAIQGSDYGYGSFDECSEAERLQLEIPRIKSRLIDSGGSLDLIGTPSSQSKSVQYYHHLVKLGAKMKDGYFCLKGIMDDNAFLGKEEIANAKQDYLLNYPHLYAQIFKGEFVATGGKMFAVSEIEQMWDERILKPVPGSLPNFNVMTQPKRIFAIDWGFAEQGDPTVGYVLDISQAPYQVLFHFMEKNADPWKILAYVREVKNHFQCPVIMDTNAMGGNIIAKLLADLRPIHFDFHGKVKEDGIYLLKQALSYKRDYEIQQDGVVLERNPAFGKIRSYYIPQLEEQLSWYQLKDDKIEQDHVMALMMAIYHADKNPPVKKPYMVRQRQQGKEAWQP